MRSHAHDVLLGTIPAQKLAVQPVAGNQGCYNSIFLMHQIVPSHVQLPVLSLTLLLLFVQVCIFSLSAENAWR